MKLELSFTTDGLRLGGNGVVRSELARRVCLSFGPSLRQEASHTMRGQGQLAAGVINEGSVIADVPGATLRLEFQPKTNHGLFEARNGAT